MNLPNKLSILRVLLIPVIVVLMSLTPAWCNYAAAGCFLIASLTDFLDGYLARKNNWVTDFGKFIDPVADKLLVLSTFLMLIQQNLLPAWAVVIILARELSVDGLRLVAMTKNHVIAAGPLGKIKTVSQMIFILYLMLFHHPAFSDPLSIVLTVWVVGITLFSGADYFIRNKSVFQSM